MSIRMHDGYWTIFSGDQPIICCASFQAAWKIVYDYSKELEDGSNQELPAP